MRAVDAITAALAAYDSRSFAWLVGEPCFDPPPELSEALVRAAASPTFHYPPQEGVPALREVLAERHIAEGHATSPDQVAVTSGAKGGLLALLATLLEPGDELIHPRPCYPAYPAIANRLGARPIAVAEHGTGFADWSDAVADAISKRTRAVVVASPSNPTGTTLDAAEAEPLVALCRRRGIRLICDEAYVDFRFAPHRHTLPAAFDPDRATVIQVRSASKSWALCGWRLGWIVADAALVTNVARTHAALLNPASGPIQAALCELPKVPTHYLELARSKVAGRIDGLCSALEGIGIEVRRPEGGFYLWLGPPDQIGAERVRDTVRWAVDFARRTGIGLWPGEDFGAAGHVRIAVTAPPDSDWHSAVETLTEAFT